MDDVVLRQIDALTWETTIPSEDYPYEFTATAGHESVWCFISTVLFPHLDTLYSQMAKRSIGREIDWVNIKREKVILYAAFSLCFIWPFINLAVWILPMNRDYEIMVGTWGTAFVFQIVFNCIAFISGTLLCIMYYRLEIEHKRSNQFFLGLKIFGLVALLLYPARNNS